MALDDVETDHWITGAGDGCCGAITVIDLGEPLGDRDVVIHRFP